MTKPVVEYVTSEYNFIKVDMSAYVIALNHPGNDNYRGGEGAVRTSTVISYDEDGGTFETRNTIYKLAYKIAV